MIVKQQKIIKDEQGLPNYMTAFYWTGSKDPAEAPPMFVVCGEVVDAILVSQFFNTNINGTPCSLPFREPWTRISMDKAAEACRKKGAGWHLLTNAEYAYLLKESRELGTEPHGNTAAGQDYDHQEEKGVTYDGYRTLTGLDPETWSHDHTEGGVYGLKGNIWEIVQGLRLHHGTVEYIKNNDAAAAETDTGEDSAAWQQALAENGKAVRLSASNGVKITTGAVEADWNGAHMRDVELEGLDEVPQILFDLEILPPDWKERQDGIYVDSELKEAVPFRGSSFHDTSYGGASAVHLNRPRSNVRTSIGFRSALYLKYSKPTTE